jgi:excisionase family DNA binding protein
MSKSDEFLRTNEAAKRVCVAPKTIRAWVERRILPAFKPTKRTILIRESDLDKAMERFRIGGRMG